MSLDLGAHFEIECDIGEALAMLNQLARVFNPEGFFATEMTRRLTERMHLQQDESFSSDGGGDWAPLSDWSVRDRGGSASPMLQRTGAFRQATSEYVGMWSATPDAYTYIYPSLFMEEAGKYFGLTAGQRVNPLAVKRGPRGGSSTQSSPAPLKLTPRPILFGGTRMYSDVTMALREFLLEAGVDGFGISGFGGEGA